MTRFAYLLQHIYCNILFGVSIWSLAYVDMSLRKAGTMAVLKGSQEPWGVTRPPFENHCPREAWAKDRAAIPRPYARRTRQLVEILKCICSIWYITTGNDRSVQLHCPFHSGASLKASHDPAKMRCWLAQQEFPGILLQHLDSDWPVLMPD